MFRYLVILIKKSLLKVEYFSMMKKIIDLLIDLKTD